MLGHAARGLYMLLVARALGPQLYSLFAVAQAWYMALIPLAAFGLAGVLAREIGRGKEPSQDLIDSSAVLALTATLAACLISILGAYLIHGESELAVLLFIMTAALAGRAVSLWTTHVFIAVEKSRLVLVLESIFRPLEIFFGLTVLYFDGGIIGLSIVHGALWWIQGFCGLYLIHRELGFKLRIRATWTATKRIVGHAMPFLMAGLLMNWLLQGPLVLFSKADIDPAVIGNFAIAIQVLHLAIAFPQSLSSAALPVITRAADRKDGKDKLFLGVTFKIALFTGCLAGFFGTTVGPWLVPLILGDEYRLTGDILGWILCLLAPAAIIFVFPATFYARGMNLTSTIASLIGSVLLTALALSDSIHGLELSGILIALSVALTASACYLIVSAVRHDLIQLGDEVLRPIAAAIAATLIFVMLLPLNGWVALAGGTVGLPLLAILTGAIRRTEIEAVRGAISRSKTGA
ncbi:MAG: hypothetical protein N838_15035 [Thiohalocapsa sp. PB-PSB1]|nr:MAG: hypothetical protein N838_15035 [Thiohalocapsa sp. PB-PSB1]